MAQHVHTAKFTHFPFSFSLVSQQPKKIKRKKETSKSTKQIIEQILAKGYSHNSQITSFYGALLTQSRNQIILSIKNVRKINTL